MTNNKIFKDSVLLKEGEKYRIINLNNINKGKTKGRLDLTRIPSKEKIERIRLNKPKTNYIIKKNFNDNNNIILLEENEKILILLIISVIIFKVSIFSFLISKLLLSSYE